MNYISAFIEWFEKYNNSGNVDMVQLVLTLGLATLNSLYTFFVYHSLTRKTFYTKRNNIAISAVAVITTAIIFTVQSDIVLSLGVIGALAIVRFRTAMKDPLDVTFLFWAVVNGICYGAHMAEIAILLSAVLTLVILSLEGNIRKAGNRLLILEYDENVCEEAIRGQLQKGCKRFKIKKEELEVHKRKMIVEVVVKQELQLLHNLQNISGLKGISLVAHEGEHNY